MYSGFGWFVAEGAGFRVFMLQCFWVQGFGHCVGHKASDDSSVPGFPTICVSSWVVFWELNLNYTSNLYVYIYPLWYLNLNSLTATQQAGGLGWASFIASRIHCKDMQDNRCGRSWGYSPP